MAEERPQIEALNAWFRRCLNEWRRKTWLTSIAAVLAMITALGCYIVHTTGPHDNIVLKNAFVAYLLLLGPLVTLYLVTQFILIVLPPQEVAMAFEPAMLYRSVVRSVYQLLLIPFSLLWLFPWTVVIAFEAHNYGAPDPGFSDFLLLVGQLCLALLAAMQLQIHIVVYLAVTSPRSPLYHLPALVLVAYNGAWIAYINFADSVNYLAYEKYLKIAAAVLAALFVILLVRTAIKPRRFTGLWLKE